MKVKRSEMWRAAVLLLLTGCVCASVPEEPADRAAPSDGYCSWITRAQPHGAGGRREGFSEFRLRVEGDPEHYNPGSIYRVSLYATNPAYFRGFTLIALKEGHNGDQEEDYAGNFQKPVSLYATNPAYFRGFTLIALKEGHNGDQEEDYAGNFQ
ncbi:spondin-1-like, partial [Sinocyclocheilus rhinocerous]|uniref:spondin-1-like n=1 Tax=Sinocyclocheilus rhinocerous TaxID=307959 RepID=UPI0007B85592